MTRQYTLWNISTGEIIDDAASAETAATALGVTVEELLARTYHPFRRFSTPAGIVMPNAGAAE
jgi:hypothetical protein